MTSRSKNDVWVSAVIVDDDSIDESEEVFEITPFSQKSKK
jgi:hypothetical protein